MGGVSSQGSGVSELELESGIDIFFMRIINAETQRRGDCEVRVRVGEWCGCVERCGKVHGGVPLGVGGTDER